MEHGDVTDRLRQIGRAPVDPDLAHRHLGALASTQPAGVARSFARVAVVLAAVALFLVAPAAALVANAQDDDPDPVVPAEAPDEADTTDTTGPVVTTETTVAAGRMRRARRAQNWPIDTPPVTSTSRNSRPEMR